MDKPGASGLARTKSEQLVETIAAAFRSPPSNESGGAAENGGTLSRTKSSKRLLTAASPGQGGAAAAAAKSTHIRKSRSAQMKFDLEDLTSSAALTRASSASLGLSFSFTGFTMPPDDIADSKPFSDDDIPEDLEAGMRKPKFQMEPSLPIYLKERLESYLAIQRGP